MVPMLSANTALILSLLLAAPAAAQSGAQPGALPAGVSPAASLQVSDTVHCAYDQMSTEDREMALLLLEREVGSSNKTHENSPNLKVIDRLVDAARDKCAAPYAWTGGRSEAAVAFAMNELMSEGVAQALEAKGHPIAPIEEFFTARRGDLAGLSDITGANSEAFRAYLITRGWEKSESSSLGIAEFYLESLLHRDSEARRFTAATKAALPSMLKTPPSRARTARRGRH